MTYNFKLKETRQDIGLKKVWNVERWENGSFKGGLKVKDNTWSDPMFGAECDFPTLEDAILALTKICGVKIDIERQAFKR